MNQKIKDYARSRIAEVAEAKTEVAFALTSLHSGKARIQVYTR